MLTAAATFSGNEMRMCLSIPSFFRSCLIRSRVQCVLLYCHRSVTSSPTRGLADMSVRGPNNADQLITPAFRVASFIIPFQAHIEDDFVLFFFLWENMLQICLITDPGRANNTIAPSWTSRSQSLCRRHFRSAVWLSSPLPRVLYSRVSSRVVSSTR